MLMLIALAALAVASGAPLATRVELQDPAAVCLDGSRYRFYISRGANRGGVLFFHQGGGWCQTLEECASRAGGHEGAQLGSSHWTDAVPTIDLATGSWGRQDVYSRDKAVNPLMYDFNFVYLPYCDGGSFTGDSTGVYNGTSLHFRGLAIRRALVRELGEVTAQATDVVVSGCSAGGLAAFLHTDWYASVLPHAKTRGMPNSGWFLDGHYIRDKKPDYVDRMENLFGMMNSSAGLDPRCLLGQQAVAD